MSNDSTEDLLVVKQEVCCKQSHKMFTGIVETLGSMILTFSIPHPYFLFSIPTLTNMAQLSQSWSPKMRRLEEVPR